RRAGGEGERQGVARGGVAVPPREEREGDDGVGDARAREGLPEGLGPEIEVVLVVSAGVDPDPARGAKRLAVHGREPHRVPGEPPLPYLGDELAGIEAERELDASTGRGGGRRGGPVDLEQERVGAPA